MSQYILYTHQYGNVSICHPAQEALAAFCCGGGWPYLANADLDSHIEAEIAAGRPAWLAQRFIHALAFGGCTTAEAYAIIRDRDCRHGTGHELVTLADLPQDRWFRNAWRRSHNGGPITIDMKAARAIQLRRIKSTAARHKVELELPRWRERIRRADSLEELRQIFPKGLK